MDEDWLCVKLGNLKIKKDCVSILTEIYTFLKDTPNLESKVTDQLLISPEIYNYLDEDDETADTDYNCKIIELVTKIFRKCVGNISMEGNSDLYRFVQRAITHKRKQMRVLALIAIREQISKQALYRYKEITEIISLDLVHQIFFALEYDDLDVAYRACNILSLILENYIDETSVKNAIAEGLKKGKYTRYRLYEMAVGLANRSEVILAKVEFILDQALTELDKGDIFLEANVINILGGLITEISGISYLEKRQVVEKLGERVAKLEKSPLNRLLVPRIMKFFALKPFKIINECPHIMYFLFECFKSRDISMFPAAFDTLVNLTETEPCIYLLETKYAAEMKYVFETYSYVLAKWPTHLKLRAFDSLKSIFEFQYYAYPGFSVILERWFKIFSNGAKDLQFLLTFCKHPLPGIKGSTIGLIRNISACPWGVEAIKHTAGFVEYLLDRNVELYEDAKYMKYRIIIRLAYSGAFNEKTAVEMFKYINDGPY